MFSHLCSYVKDCEMSIGEALQNDIASHLQSLKDEFCKYFPETTKSQFTLVRNPSLAKMKSWKMGHDVEKFETPDLNRIFFSQRGTKYCV